MAESIKNESVECELRLLIDEMAARSMSVPPGDNGEGQAVCENFAVIHRLASEAGLEDVAALAQSLQNAPLSGDVTYLRDAVRQIQEKMETTTLQHKISKEVPVVSQEMSLADPELVADFLVESREHLVAAEEHALALEKEPGDTEAVNALFRAFHSIKGLAAFLDFDRVYRFAHEVETLLDHARNHELVVTPAVIDAILASADFLLRCMDAIESGVLAELPATEGIVVEQIRQLISACAKPPENSNESQLAPSCVPVASTLEDDIGALVGSTPSVASTTPDNGNPELPLTEKSATESSPSSARGKGNAERYSIRVDTDKLDYLMDIVGELVIAQSLMRTEIMDKSSTNWNLTRNLGQLTQITSDVQRTTLRMRMIPIGQLLQRSSRIVRDLARKCGKPVEIEIDGEDTEVDKTIAEELSDPLMHIVRNAIDHGIESPKERASAGKSAVARIRFSASHEGSQIVVQVSDDGKGLDRAKILRKARERNLISNEELTDKEVAELIFNPGFSTAEVVTTISGRGVGMDVVRRHVEKLRGRVDVESTPGAGTKFIIRLPLTRAIIDGLVVRVGESRFVIPLSSVREIFRPAESSISTVQTKGELVLLHNRLLPIVRLHRRLSISPSITDPWDAVLIVAESEGRQFCLMVDELIGKQEVVVKSLGQFLKSTPGVSGGTILGDGKVGLIVDVQQLEVRA